MDQKTAQQVASAFIKFYYTALNKDVSKLATVYKNESILTWGVTSDGKSTEHVGKAIGAHLSTFAATKPEHKINSTDVQVIDKSLLLMVTGDVKLNNTVVKFAETFQLVPSDPSGKSFWIFNDIFRVAL